MDRIKNQPPFDPPKETEVSPPQEPPKEEKKPQDTTVQIEEQPDIKPDETNKTSVKEEETGQVEKQSQSERTKEQIDKLKEHNQNLKQELDKQKKVTEDVLQSLTAKDNKPGFLTNHPPTVNNYPNLSKQDVKNIWDKLVDDNGLVDVKLLKEELKKQNDRAAFAEQKVKEANERVANMERKFEDFERTNKMKLIHAKYPQIDPNSQEFNPDMWEAVRNEIVGQWVTEGKEDVEKAAAKWHKIMYKDMNKQQKKAEDKKANINALSPKSSSNSGEYEDQEALVQATRKNKKGALGERLRRAGY
jgi:hypothetical protein